MNITQNFIPLTPSENEIRKAALEAWRSIEPEQFDRLIKIIPARCLDTKSAGAGPIQ